MINFTAAASAGGEVQRHGPPFDPHISIDIDDDRPSSPKSSSRRASPSARSSHPSGRQTAGSAMGSEADRRKFVEQVHKARAEKLRLWGASHRRRSHRLRRQPRRLGERSRRQPEDHRRHVPRRRRRRRRSRRASPLSEICWGGMHSGAHGPAPRDDRPPRDRRLPGRHGPHASTRWATTPPKMPSSPRISIGRASPNSTTRSRC